MGWAVGVGGPVFRVHNGEANMLVIVIIADGAKPKRTSKPKPTRKRKAATVADGLDVAAMNRRSKRY
jgi:hypothetical protein